MPLFQTKQPFPVATAAWWTVVGNTINKLRPCHVTAESGAVYLEEGSALTVEGDKTDLIGNSADFQGGERPHDMPGGINFCHGVPRTAQELCM